MDVDRLSAQLKEAEGVRLTAYRDSLGYWTAGVGHLLPQTHDWSGVQFSMDTVMGWLIEDINTAAANAATLPEWSSLDTPARCNAIVELVFNMGLGRWQGFKHCRTAIEKRDWNTAHDQLLDSAWAGQVQPHGLDKPGRATRIADAIRTGEF